MILVVRIIPEFPRNFQLLNLSLNPLLVKKIPSFPSNLLEICGKGSLVGAMGSTIKLSQYDRFRYNV